MTHDMRLDKLMAFLWIQSARDVLSHTLEYILAKSRWFRRGSYGMEVNNAKVTIMVIEHLRPVPDST
jgi:hypothetical protein